MALKGSKQFWLQEMTHHNNVVMLQGILQILKPRKNPCHGDKFCQCPE